MAVLCSCDIILVVLELLTVGGKTLGAIGQADDVTISFQDEDLVVTAGDRHNVSAALQSSNDHLKNTDQLEI